MRISVVLSALVLVCACQRTDPAERSARATAAPAPAQAVASTAGAAAPLSAAHPVAVPHTAAAGEHADHEAGMCGGSCGASCGGHCNGSCMAGTEAPAQGAVPSDAHWAELHVEGMHCGGCARRIQAALAKVDGVVGSEVDLGTKTVKVAVRGSTDARALATPAIDGLGYHVVP